MARIADRILVMERGRIVQDGRHAELIVAPGPYARMFQAQRALVSSRSDLKAQAERLASMRNTAEEVAKSLEPQTLDL